MPSPKPIRMSPLLSTSLIKVARCELADARPQDKTQVNLRLACQAAYRATYHALCESIAEPYCGAIFSPAHPLLRHIYPIVNTMSLRSADTSAFKTAFSQSLVDFITTMACLKRKAHIAADNAHFPIPPNVISQDIDRAEMSIAAFLDIPLMQRQKMTLYLLMHPR